ncbi:MAG: hypothetical protein Q7O66_05760, partial [Dehalococcoidia bacterium]|nr:hypothetical protein [Dehalococcoidia bacterium]
RYDRIWLVGWQDYFSDPDNRIRQWLDDNTTQLAFKPFRLIALTGYRTAPVVMRSIPNIQNAAGIDFDNGIRFLGYDLDTSQTSAKGRLYVTLYWQARGPVAKSFNVYVKLINQGYHVWGQKDNRPVYDRVPTNVWQTGEVFRDEYALDILPGTPPGSYHLAVGLYDPTNWTASNIVTSGDDHLSLGPVEIPRISRSPTIANPKKVGFGDSVQFLGYNIESDWKPGSGLHLTLFWQATGPISKDYTVFNHLLDVTGRLVSQKDSPPAAGAYPTSKWQAGEIVRDQYDMELPKDISPGSVSLQVGMYDGATGERLPLRDNPKTNYLSIGSFAVRP